MIFRRLLSAATVLAGLTISASAQTERVVVYGTLPDSDIGVAQDKVPGSLQSLSADDVGAAHGTTVLDSLSTRAAGVGLSDLQGNNMFQDLRYHGFEASPLQGVAEGVAVYQNGVRLNEAFGDTVNWDAIPETAVAHMDVWSNNPVFGLNALGGAINIVMKTGFTWTGTEASLQGGSFGHAMGTLQYGVEDGDFNFYVAAEGVTDDGWRLHSESNLGRLYADAGWRFGDSEIHLVASGSQSGLGVIGPTPIDATVQNPRAIYTWPQTTQNRIGSLALNGKTKLADHWQVEASVYVRTLRQRHVDGNDADFERCSARSSFGGDLCLEDDAFGTPPGGKTTAFRDQFVIMNSAGAVFAFDPDIIYGTVDRTFTDTTSQGATVQVSSDDDLFGLKNYFTAGGSIDHSAIGFRSTSTLGAIFPDLSVASDPGEPDAGNVIHTQGNLGYAPANLGGTTDYYGVYAVDALDITDTVTITAGFRLNAADIATRDRSGLAAELTGSHGYTHLNPLAGLTWKIADGLSFFGGYSESNRAPTPLELDCASPTQPCLLEGSLVADPPLKQVVADTGEFGLRGEIAAPLNDGTPGKFSWSASLFRTDSDNDIVTLASVIQGRGYFANVPLTRRQGIDVSAQYATQGWSLYASYSYLDATYQFAGTLTSPNNPFADDDGNVSVVPGNHIPFSPTHQARFGGDGEILPGLTVGGDLVFTGSQFFDGDNANQNPTLPSYWTANLRVAYAFDKQWQIFGLVNNVFNQRAASYGTFFDPDDAEGLFTPDVTDPRTITPIQPVSFQAGIKIAF
jgi:iron complex outermembrane recepter protein